MLAAGRAAPPPAAPTRWRTWRSLQAESRARRPTRRPLAAARPTTTCTGGSPPTCPLWRSSAEAGEPLRRRCTNTTGQDWQETCTVWDEGRRFAVDVDTSDYPYPLRLMRGLWQVDRRSRRQPGHHAVRLPGDALCSWWPVRDRDAGAHRPDTEQDLPRLAAFADIDTRERASQASLSKLTAMVGPPTQPGYDPPRALRRDPMSQCSWPSTSRGRLGRLAPPDQRRRRRGRCRCWRPW